MNHQAEFCDNGFERTQKRRTDGLQQGSLLRPLGFMTRKGISIGRPSRKIPLHTDPTVSKRKESRRENSAVRERAPPHTQLNFQARENCRAYAISALLRSI